jgi:holin-like protein
LNTSSTAPSVRIADDSPSAAPRLRDKRWAQVAALIAIWAVADASRGWLGLPLPGSVIGLFAVWLLLEFRVIPLSSVEQGADSLLNHLVLFFVPAMLALVGHPELLSLTGVKLVAAILLGTVIVMCGTAVVVEIGFRLGSRRSA